MLRYDDSLIAEAKQLLTSAFESAKQQRDWLRWHRAGANLARLGFLTGDESAQLPLTFDMAISLGQLCLDRGFPVDQAFYSRRDEILHMAGVVKFNQQDMAYPNLCAHIKSPARIKPQPGGVRLTLEEGRLIGNISFPLTVAMNDRIRKSSEHAAFVDLLCLDDRLQIWMVHRGKYLARQFAFRELHLHDALDIIFRPSQFEVMFDSPPPTDSTGSTDEGEVANADENADSRPSRVSFVPWNGNVGDVGLSSSVLEGKTWAFRSPILTVGFDSDGQSYRSLDYPDLVGLHWERLLGELFEQILPDSAELRHLVLSTDGPLALLPAHLAELSSGELLRDRYSISYTPTLERFSPADVVRQEGAAYSVAFLINTRNRLQGPIWELARMQERFGEASVRVLDQISSDVSTLQDQLFDCDIVHIATHGYSFTDTPEASGIDLGNGNTLSIKQIENLALKEGCLVFLNACGSHRVVIRSRIQFSSIANAFLAAGAATVIATFWETDDVAAALLSDRYYHNYVEGGGRLESLEQAIGWIRALDLDDLDERELGRLSLFLPVQRTKPYAKSNFWRQFSLFGQW